MIPAVDFRLPADYQGDLLQLLRKTALQVNKDAEDVWTMVQPDDTVQDAVYAIKNGVYLGIKTLLEDNPELLPALCYRIDLQEADVDAALGGASTETIAAQLAMLIINRVISKVLLRERFQ